MTSPSGIGTAAGPRPSGVSSATAGRRWPAGVLPAGPVPRLLRAWWPRDAAEAVRISLTAIAAVWLSMWLELQAPHWAGWTVMSVTLATRAASLRKSLWRTAGTTVGVTFAITLTANFAQATLAFDVVIALWLGLFTAASTIESGQRSYGFALMGFTVPIIAFANVDHPGDVFSTGIDRCSTILLGIACAYASNTLVAAGVPEVARGLAGKLDAAADACGAWLASAAAGSEPAEAFPGRQVTALGEAVIDAFSEQPSLRCGGRAIRDAAPRLRRALAAGLLRTRLPEGCDTDPAALLGDGGGRSERQLARVRVAARLLRRGGRIGRRRVSFRPHILLWSDLDWDGRHALRNSLRTVAAVSIVDAFWYATGWTGGATAATWAGLLSILLASHLDPVAEARAFLVGTVLASVVGLVVHYGVLTMPGDFTLLAAVLLPVCMMAVLGRADRRAVYGAGFGFLIFDGIDPTNLMTYDLAGSLNGIVAELLGIGFAVVAFSALPPPVTAAALRRRARGRLLGGVRHAALDPRFLLARRDRWLSRSFGRLDIVAQDAEAAREGRTLLLVGLLLLALREADDDVGRRVGRAAWAALDPRTRGEGEGARAMLGDMAERAGGALQRERIHLLAALVADLDVARRRGSSRAVTA